MSLFKVRTWWTAQCSDIEENYDIASLICARFGIENFEKDFIIVGSQSGLLSIFYPNPITLGSGHNIQELQVKDLFLECQFKTPIVSILSGRFYGENTNQLAVLHPNNLTIYNFTTMNGLVEHGSHSQLQIIVEHTFSRPAFSFCKGHFGQVKGREFLCIGHLDGNLTFYEQDGISYKCKLPGPQSLPSAVVYLEQNDSFLRMNSSWHLECFSYQDLSHSAINNSDASPVWSLCIGEGVLNLTSVQVKQSLTLIMILGERNFMAVSDHGDIDFIIKLDFAPKCFCSFLVGYYWEPDSRLITAIISENYKLFIYNGMYLAWAAQLEDIPVALQRTNVNNLPGGIVTLGPTGLIKVSYLGSDQHVFQVVPLNTEEINFERAHKELLFLENEIKQAIDLGDVDVVNEMASNDLTLKFQINSVLNECHFEVPLDLADIPMCSGCLIFESNASFEEIQIAFSTPHGVRCSQDAMTLNEVVANTKKELVVQFYLEENLFIETSKVELFVSYINKQGIPRVLTKIDYLPLTMLFKRVPPQKKAPLKVTLSVHSKLFPTKLSTLFPEFCSTENDIQALGLSLLQLEQQQKISDDNADATVTILIANNSNRIRIQSNIMEILPLVLERILNKINEMEMQKDNPIKRKVHKNKKFLRTNGNDEESYKLVTASPTIPYEEILNIMDVHYMLQKDIRKQMVLMDSLWYQLKLFQRSFQEKIEGEIKEGLVWLIEKNYDDMVKEADKLVELRITEKGYRSKLSCAVSIGKMLVLCLPIASTISNLIASILVTPVEDWTELSWEILMSPGIDMLHHYGPLSKTKIVNDDQIKISNEKFEYERFRRYFLMIFERVCRLSAVSETAKFKNIDDSEEENEVEKCFKITKPTKLEALQDDEEENFENDETFLETKPENDWNVETNELSNIFTNMLLKNNK